jgi:sulfite reductase beta subunit-like hemoprotein
MESDRVPEPPRLALAPEERAEIAMLAEQIEQQELGVADPESCRRSRLENGIYGIRGTPDQHMVRVKVRLGRLTDGQLLALADIADRFTPNRKVHLTTRQDVQFHFVQRRSLPEVLTRIAEAGLTTREACGNTVRNVTACPVAGISPSEVFDVRPYADSLSLHFLRNPIGQNMPRKFKVAFEGCAEDHARTAIHDFGVVAAVRSADGKVERGFRIYLGGGLGAQPVSARLLEDFTPEALLIPTAEAVLRIFDRFGERREDRAHRMRARLKFLIREWGWEKFREAVLKERRVSLWTRSGKTPVQFDTREELPPFDPETVEKIALELRRPAPQAARLEGEADGRSSFERWRNSNVLVQRQEGWRAVVVRAPLGDLSSEELRSLSAIAGKFCGGRVQVSIEQNLLLRWVPEALVEVLYKELDHAGLAHGGAGTLADVTRCPGADTCQIAITHSKGLAEALVPITESSLGRSEDVERLSLKISGCMNSCGQHHIADLGFYGANENVDGHELPKYALLLGGRTREGLAEFGVPVAQIPARLVPEATGEVLLFYRRGRHEDESFRDFVQRIGKPAFRELLARFQATPSYGESPELFRDLGVETEFEAPPVTQHGRAVPSPAPEVAGDSVSAKEAR